MTKKLIAMLLCVMMIASIVTIPAFADEISYADYVPGAKPDSLITVTGNSNDYDLQYFVNNGGDKTSHVHSYAGQYFDVSSKLAYDGTTKIGRNNYMICGARIYNEILTTPAQMDTNYVVSFWVKNLTPEYETKVNFAPTVYKRDSISQYTKEYGEAGMTLVGEDWQEFKGTLSIGSALADRESQPLPQFAIGLSTQSLTGTGARFSYNAEGTQKMYLAVEEAYDITNERTSASSILTSKTSATFKAQIVNQIGLPGYVNQGTFTWKAFAASDTERANPVSGFTFTGGADVTVTVDDTVEPGEYVIVAHNTEKGWAKGASITVDTPSPYLDYTVGTMPENLIIKKDGTVYDLQYFSENDTSDAKETVSYNSYTQNYFSVVPKLAYDGSTLIGKVATYYLPGAWTHTTILPAAKMLQDETYVVRFKARNRDGNPANAKVNFAALNYKNYLTLDYTKEYGEDGLELTGTDWQEFKGTVHIKPETVDEATARFQIGLSTKALAGVGVDIWHNYKDVNADDAVYIAYEQAYDITNSLTSGSDTIKAGESASFEAELINQIGLPGYLDQTFTWKVLDRATRKIEPADVTVSATGGKATITTSKTTTPGEYVVVAYNEANQMAKGVDLTITEPNYYEDYVKGEMPENIFICGATGMYDTMYIGTADNTENSADRISTVSRNSYGSYITIISQETGEGTVGLNYTNGDKKGKLQGAYYSSSLFSEKIQYNTNYVVSFMTKKPEGYADTKINFAALNYSSGALDYTVEYEQDGFDLTATNWTPFKATLKIGENTNGVSAAPQLLIGLSETAPKGTRADVRIVEESKYNTSKYTPEMYIAKEAAYDIKNSLKSGSATLADGAKATFGAQVVNQLELPGYLDQDIEWRVMDKARENNIDGFVIEADGAEATITVNGAAPGTYDVVAYSADYKMAKGVEITVTDAVEEVTGITVAGDKDGEFTLSSVTVENSTKAELLIVVASYDAASKKLVGVDKKVLPVSDGSIEFGDALTIKANTGNKVKVFVWDSTSYAPVALADGVLAEFTK